MTMYPALAHGAESTANGPGERELPAYRCGGINPRTMHPCGAILIEAWAPAGALVRRRCKQCGTWQTIYVPPSE